MAQKRIPVLRLYAIENIPGRKVDMEAALRKKVKSMNLWDSMINWIWERKKATHVFLVCSSKKIDPGKETMIEEQHSGAER